MKQLRTLDSLILEHNRLGRIMRYENQPGLYFWSMSLLIVTTMFMGMWDFFSVGPVPEWPYLILVTPLLVAFWLNWGELRYMSARRFYDFVLELKGTPAQLENLAIKLYGSEDGPLAALECHECHLPGDCPLCGAE